ncbi:MAG TPA: phage major capsid protein [Nitrososphaerales archaeon]|nr:phage major capsid protein [Nitrososphaerales archaeon]
MSKLQDSLKAVLDQADVLYRKVSSETATPEEMESFKSLNKQAEDLKNKIDEAKRHEDLQAWGKTSDGNAAVPATFDRLALNEEGEIKGLTADPKTGEMMVLPGFDSELGRKNLEALKSGAYLDFFTQKLRAQGNYKTAGNWTSYMKGNAMKILNEGSFTTGEAWIPPDFRANLVQRMAVMTSVRPNATVMTTGSDHVTFPQAVYTTDDLYSSPFRATWMGSGAQTSSPAEGSNPVSGQITIPVYLLTANIICQREQIEDNSFDLLGYITKIGAESFSLTQEDTYTSGNGVSKPFGFTVHPTASIANGSTSTINGTTYTGGEIFSGSSGALVWGGSTGTPTGVYGVEGVLPPQYETGAKWFATKNTYSILRAVNAGTATLPQWFASESWPNYQNGYAPTLLGYPTKKNQFMSTVATSTTGQTPAMMLGDMSAYWIVDRVGFSVEVNPWIYQDRDQVLIYMRMRTGGQLVEYWKQKFLVITA